MSEMQPEENSEMQRLRRLPVLVFAGFFAAFAAAWFISPAFKSLVGEAFGDLNEAVVTMVAWCRSL